MAVGEIFLSAFLQVLFEKLASASPEVIKFLRREKLYTTVQKWTEKLETIKDVLDDAEEKQITEANINSWLEKLEDLAYDVDDMLDMFATEALSRKQLVMMHCSNNAYLLEELDIERCGSLTSLPSSRGELPATLKRLSVKYCPKLESVVERLHGNASLETIDIWGCESLKSLPEGLYNLTSLRHLNINFCDKLSALPDRMHDLNSLQQLSISYCAGIVSFPEEGFPTNLTILKIGNLEISKPLFDWGLHRLTSLQELEIYDTCPDLVSFPEKEKEKRIILPTSLTKLSIGEFPNLEYLSFHTLQSLTSLSISGCPKLKSFPKEGLSLSSLEYLEINDCPKLKSFPKEGLPLSLLQLHIEDCPLLKRQCEKDKGRDWPKIAHIPCVEIDGWFIYESPEIAE